MRRNERGTVTVELVGILPWLFILAFAVWQILLIAYTANAAENAARSGSRAEGMGKEGVEAAQESLPSWLREGSRIEIDGERAIVRLKVPVIVPAITIDSLSIVRDAELPGD